jgi:hypothetical protein
MTAKGLGRGAGPERTRLFRKDQAADATPEGRRFEPALWRTKNISDSHKRYYGISLMAELLKSRNTSKAERIILHCLY